MHKNFFYNNKSLSENKNKTTQISKVDTKSVVDINMLLNRVKIEEKKETKRKIIFFSFATLVLSLFGTFIAIIR